MFAGSDIFEGPLRIPIDQTNVDFGTGLYSFRWETDQGRKKFNRLSGNDAAWRWARSGIKKRAIRNGGGGGAPFVIVFAVETAILTRFQQQGKYYGTPSAPTKDFWKDVNENRRSSTPVRYNVPLVYGPTAKFNHGVDVPGGGVGKGSGGWVADRHLPVQYKFEPMAMANIKPVAIYARKYEWIHQDADLDI